MGHITDRIAVMYAGRMVELGVTEELLAQPKHPYTEALLAAVPIPDPSLTRDRQLLSGEVADPANLPTGGVFHPRCPHAEDRCKTEVPDLREITAGHFARCHFA